MLLFFFKRLIFVFLYFGFCLISFAQERIDPYNYYKYLNISNDSLIHGKYLKAKFYFGEAFKYSGGTPFARDLFLAALSSFRAGDTATTFNFLRQYAHSGGDISKIKSKYLFNKSLISDCQLFLNFIFQKKFTGFRSELKKSYLAKRRSLNRSVIRKIAWLAFKDQFIMRTLLIPILPSKLESRMMKRIDSSNFLGLRKLCIKHGKFIDFSFIGEEKFAGPHSLSNVDVMLQHFTKFQILSLDSFVRLSIGSLNYYPETWSRTWDYLSIRSNEKWINADSVEIYQIYGTFIIEKSFLLPHNGRENSNILRRNLFLPDIDYTARFWDVQVNPTLRYKFRAATPNKNWNK